MKYLFFFFFYIMYIIFLFEYVNIIFCARYYYRQNSRSDSDLEEDTSNDGAVGSRSHYRVLTPPGRRCENTLDECLSNSQQRGCENESPNPGHLQTHTTDSSALRRRASDRSDAHTQYAHLNNRVLTSLTPSILHTISNRIRNNLDPNCFIVSNDGAPHLSTSSRKEFRTRNGQNDESSSHSNNNTELSDSRNLNSTRYKIKNYDSKIPAIVDRGGSELQVSAISKGITFRTEDSQNNDSIWDSNDNHQPLASNELPPMRDRTRGRKDNRNNTSSKRNNLLQPEISNASSFTKHVTKNKQTKVSLLNEEKISETSPSRSSIKTKYKRAEDFFNQFFLDQNGTFWERVHDRFHFCFIMICILCNFIFKSLMEIIYNRTN